jgi:GDP-L-fucose synthase
MKLNGKSVFVAGHNGMVGSALVRRLARERVDLVTASRSELDLVDQAAVRRFFESSKIDAVVVAAAKVGGIQANASLPFDFLYQNLMISANVIEAAASTGVEKLLFLGSSCIYPKLAPQPISEDALLKGPLEPTNEWYSIAKIAGIKICQALRRQKGCDFISCQPSNLYGPKDNFDLESSHVLAALLCKMHYAKTRAEPAVVVWGSGRPRREFVHADDVADACVFLLEKYSEEAPINVGQGSDITIAELAALVASVVGYEGDLVFDETRPDGTPRKLLDTSRLESLGWRPRIQLEDGLKATYAWFLENEAKRSGADKRRAVYARTK